MEHSEPESVVENRSEVIEDTGKAKHDVTPEIPSVWKEKPIIADKKKKLKIIVALVIFFGLLVIACAFLIKIFYNDIVTWHRESKYYGDGKNYLEIVSMEPPSGVPVDPAEVKSVVITFNHPLDKASMETGCYRSRDVSSLSSISLSQDHTVITVTLPSEEFEMINEFIVFTPDLKDSRGNSLAKSGHYTFRNSNPPICDLGMDNLFLLKLAYDSHPDSMPPGFMEKYGRKNKYDELVYQFEFAEPFHRYPLLLEETESIFDNVPFPPLSLRDAENRTWTPEKLKGKNTLFIVQSADGFIDSPDSTDIARIIRKYYSPAELQIIVAYISVDHGPVVNRQKEVGKNILVLSDFEGYRGQLNSFLVHSPTMLPLTFFIDKKGEIRSSYTGLVHVRGIVEGAKILGLKPTFPEPETVKVKYLKDQLKKDPRNVGLYGDLGKLYEDAGDFYDASLSYHKAFKYGLVNEPLKKNLYNRFLSWGMSKEATDLYVDCDMYDTRYADDYFRGAMASRRLGHPNMWDLNSMMNMLASRAIQIQSSDHRGIYPVAIRNLAEFRRRTKVPVIFMGSERDALNTMESDENSLFKLISESKKVFRGHVGPKRMMAEFYELKAEFPMAYHELKAGMKLKGFNDVDRGHLALYAAKSGHFDEARQLALQALKTKSMWEAHYALGKYYLNKKAYREAADELNKALALNQWYDFCYQDYAIALKNLGQTSKAAEVIEFSKYITQEVEKNGMRDINLMPRN